MYSKYIGRVGALAVALGIGGAIATAPGVAWADEPSASSASDASSRSTASSSASDESSTSTSSASNSPSTRPTSTTPSEHSSDDDTGGPVSQSGASISSSEIVTNDESGVIVRSSGGSHTSGIDNQTVRGSQDDEAAAPDLEQPITPEDEVALQAPPETQVTTPPAAPTRTVAPTKKNSDTKKVAPLTASTRTVAPIEKNSDTKQAHRSADAPAVSTEMGEPACNCGRLPSRQQLAKTTNGTTSQVGPRSPHRLLPRRVRRRWST